MDINLQEQFQWDNPSQVTVAGNTLRIKAHPHSDYFVDPADGTRHLSGAFYYTEGQEDFVLRAKVSHAFTSVYDACALMVMGGDTCWAKICFELTDLGTHSIVSMVTNVVSDDANGVDIQGNQVHLQIAKKGNVFGLYYSLDGNRFNMVRYFTIPIDGAFKLGFVAQSPLGEGGDFVFEEIALNYVSVGDIRKGI